jgi:hypothetical protein
MKKRDIILIVGGVAFLALVVCLVLLLADKFDMDKAVCGCPKVISHNFVWIFIVLAIVFVSCLLYYLFSLKIDSQRGTINKNREILFSILDEDEKKVIKKLINNNGKIVQSDLSLDFGKLKAHRVIKKLEEKKIIDIKKDGKTNQIKLKGELRRELG